MEEETGISQMITPDQINLANETALSLAVQAFKENRYGSPELFVAAIRANILSALIIAEAIRGVDCPAPACDPTPATPI